MQVLRSAIEAVLPLSEEEWEALAACWQPVSHKRKTVLTAAGETERYVYFVLEGVQRAFCIAENQREATLVFSYTGSFSGIIDSFFCSSPRVIISKPLPKAPCCAFRIPICSG